MTVKLLSHVNWKKIALQLQLNQLVFKNSHQEICLFHFSLMEEKNVILKKLCSQLNHGQEVAKFIKQIEFAILTS